MANYKIPITTLLFALILGTSTAFAQSYWEPQTNITGYISTEFNWFDDLEGFDYNYGVSVSEAGVLVNYKPTSKLTLNSVFVYRPGYNFDKMLNEFSGEYELNSYLNVKVGRFLQTLSPMNTFYYAPVNTSATLPIIVSNNEFFPLNVDGISFNGNFGQDFKINYDVFGGTYTNALFKQTGAIGFFGNEVNYFNALNGVEPTTFPDFKNLAYAGTVGFSYKNFVDVGFGLFNPNDEIVNVDYEIPEGFYYEGSPAESGTSRIAVEKITFGTNVKLQYNNTRLLGEWWRANLYMNYKDMGSGMEFSMDTPDYKGYYVELSHRINKLTPYARYENQDAGALEYDRITTGFNYKPNFETTFKIEYLAYLNDADDVHGLVAAFIFSF